MRLKLMMARADGTRTDVVVTADAAARVADIAAELQLADPRLPLGERIPAPTLAVRLPGTNDDIVLAPDLPVSDAVIASGAGIRVVEAAHYSAVDAAHAPVVATLTLLDGGATAQSVPLRAGSIVIGRDPSCDIVLTDPLISKRHLRLDIGSVVEAVDLGSANGIVVDGGLVQRVTVRSAEQLLIGDTRVLIEVAAMATNAGAPTAGSIAFNRSPRIEERYNGTEFASPEVPPEPEERPFPWLAMLSPALLGLGLFAVTQRLTSLLFVALSPIGILGGFLTQKQAEKRRLKRQIAIFDSRLDSLRTELAGERERERATRLAEAPSTAEAYEQAMKLGPLLWTRRPEHWNFLNLRIGLGAMRSRNTIETRPTGEILQQYQEHLDALVGEFERVDGVPIVDNLHEAGALGIAGVPSVAGPLVNGLLVQLTALHSPAEVVVTALVTPAWSRRLDWLTWMPHTSSPHSPLSGTHLADSPSSAAALLSSLEAIIEQRTATNRALRRGAMRQADAALERGAGVGEGTGGEGVPAPLPAIVVLISDDLPVDRARLVQLAERAADAGVYPIWLADERSALPAVCRTYVEADDDPSQASVGFVRLGETVRNVVVEPVEAAWALSYGRRMAAVIDSGAVIADSSDIPPSVSLVSLLGPDMAEASTAVIDRWRQNESIHDRSAGGASIGAPAGPAFAASVAPNAPTARAHRRAGKLRAIVGSTGADAMQLDLRAQGPHALVGGTTGAGKSEFLQAWVLGMAAEYSPDRVTFLFIDYKGGSAFADCVHLPHCVGLVTDLSPHLVRRALTSLRAELHHREHLLNRKKAKDLLELEKRGDPESPPALVLVIDEFAALVGEVPEFVDGVVDIAQRGRSLGIHLIMATQRPAGVIKDNLRANTNLRIALRMADESDSTDVVGVKDAAHFDPGLPGRGVAKSGPGRIAMFQSAYAGGHTSREPERPTIAVAELRFGSETLWEAPGNTLAPVTDAGPTDQQRLVHTIVAASRAAGVPAPRRPWLDEIAPLYDLRSLGQTSDSALVIGVCDVPAQQAQRPLHFLPDTEGHLAVYGTGGSGKSTLLRTLAAASGLSFRTGTTHVYGLDFGSGSLRMLSALPHVGGIIAGDDTERIARLFRMLRAELDRRAELWAALDASTIGDYRRASGTDEARILLLVDGFPAFREDFEVPSGRSQFYDVFRDILTEGRRLGMHVALTADRPGAVPTAIAAGIQRRVVLRLADDAGYTLLGEPSDVLGAGSPAGRAVVDGLEVQVAMLGGAADVAEQGSAMRALARQLVEAGVEQAPEIGAMPREIEQRVFPPAVGGRPVLGVGEATLGAIGFDPAGVMLLSGPPASGRSNALDVLAESFHRFDPEARLYYLGNSRSLLARSRAWTAAAVTNDEVAALARDLAAAVADPDTEGRIAVFVESINDFLQTPADGPVVELVKAVKRSDHFLLAEAEASGWVSSWPLIAEVKNARTGILLRPDTSDGDLILKTTLPRVNKAEFPAGRGFLVSRGSVERVQLPVPAVANEAAADFAGAGARAGV